MLFVKMLKQKQNKHRKKVIPINDMFNSIVREQLQE